MVPLPGWRRRVLSQRVRVRDELYGYGGRGAGWRDGDRHGREGQRGGERRRRRGWEEESDGCCWVDWSGGVARVVSIDCMGQVHVRIGGICERCPVQFFVHSEDRSPWFIAMLDGVAQIIVD